MKHEVKNFISTSASKAFRCKNYSALNSNFQYNCCSWIVLLSGQSKCNALERSSIPSWICTIHLESSDHTHTWWYQCVTCRNHVRHGWAQCCDCAIRELDPPYLTTSSFYSLLIYDDRCSSVAVEFSWSTTGDTGVAGNHLKCWKEKKIIIAIKWQPIAIYKYCNQWITSPWKKAGLDVMQNHLLCRTYFGPSQAPSAVLWRPRDGDCYLMHRMQSGGLPYLYRR